MWDLGLSFSDISIITGFVPFITFAFSPILGEIDMHRVIKPFIMSSIDV